MSRRRRWLGLVALTIGVAMIIVDATIVNVAIPSIIRDLHIGITQAEWANSIYSLVFAALLISVGRIGDVTGPRRVFIWCLLVFLGASLITALAPSGTVLLARRVRTAKEVLTIECDSVVEMSNQPRTQNGHIRNDTRDV